MIQEAVPVFLQSNDHLLLDKTAQQNPKIYSAHTHFLADEMNHFGTPDTCIFFYLCAKLEMRSMQVETFG